MVCNLYMNYDFICYRKNIGNFYETIKFQLPLRIPLPFGRDD